ncbi:hypothetical protein JCM8097_005420 [Rhodosporidiobolus ruineniae]
MDGAQGAAPRGGQGADKLAGEEVLELTTFAEKKAWIDSKIAFLSALPPIEVVSPAPPTRSEATKKDLDEWWAEHDRIEDEVEQYDMGDLAKMRRLARDKSKSALSRKDTDLIEITLTTLFAVDKLLHLLRNRRKVLALLGYRLHWEETLATAQASHRQLVDELFPSFLEKSRWQPPLAGAVSPSLSSRPLPSFSSSTSLSSSLSASTSSRRLSATPSTSMSRALQLQMLSLSLSQLTSHTRQLTSSLLPASASALDKLIDHSPTPLPDSFLDEQDRIELEVGRATNGLREFAEGMVQGWKGAEECWSKAGEVEREAGRLEREAEEAVGQLSLPPSAGSATASPRPDGTAPSSSPAHNSSDDSSPPSPADPFSSRLTSLRSTLSASHALLSSLPSPSHPLAPTQPTMETPAVLSTLRAQLARAESALRRADDAVQAYEQAKETIARAAEVAGRMREMERRLEVAKLRMEERDSAPSRPAGPADGPRCLDPTGEGEEAWLAAWAVASSPVLLLLGPAGDATPLLRSAADVVGTLAASPVLRRVDTSVRRGVRDGAASLRAAEGAARSLIEGEEQRREGVRRAQEVVAAVDEARGTVNAATGRLREAIRRERWVEGVPAMEDPLDAPTLLSAVNAALSARLSSALSAAHDYLAASPAAAPLVEHLDSLVSTVQGEAAQLHALAGQLEGVRTQAEKMRALEGRAQEVERDLERVAREAGEEVGDGTGGDRSVEELKPRKEDLARQVDRLEKDVDDLVHRVAHDIPFLSTASSSGASSLPSPPPTPLHSPLFSAPPALPAPKVCADLDLPAQDALVRSFVNRMTARLQGQLDHARTALELVEHLERAVEWDARAHEVEDRVAKVEREVEDACGAAYGRVDNAEATLAPLVTALSSLTVSSQLASQSSLASAFSTLLPSSSSSSAPFHSHPTRRTRLEALSMRLEAAQSAVRDAQRALEAAWEDRDRRAADWDKEEQGLRDELARRAETAGTLVEEAGKLEEQVAAARARIARERHELLQREDLTETSDVDTLELDTAVAATSSLRARLEAEQAAIAGSRRELDRLAALLPTLSSPHLSLTPSSSALGSASFAQSSAEIALSRLDSLLSLADSDASAFHTARAAQLSRRRPEADDARRARFEAWQKSVESLSERVEADREEVERVAEEARAALRMLEVQEEATKRRREELLASPSLSDEPPDEGSSAGVLARAELEALQRRLGDLKRNAREHAGRASALRADEPASWPEGIPLVDSLEGSRSAADLAVEAAEAALELLAERVEDAERDEAEWAARQAAELERRNVEEEEHEQQPAPSLRRSFALPRLLLSGVAEEGADTADDPFGSASPTDPFAMAASPSLHEPPEVQRLRAEMDTVTAAEWLDSSTVLQLPTVADAEEVQRQVGACLEKLDDLEAASSDALVWTDVDGLRNEVKKKDEAAKRVFALARFGERVDTADQALSNLLDSIDAATPNLPPPSPTPGSAPLLPLPQALSVASDAVTAVRLAAIPLVDDARVERTIQRIEETWSEMLSMAEPPRAGSSASTASSTSQRSLRPRISDATSSRASSRTSIRTPSGLDRSRPSSQASSLRSSTRPTSRPPSSASTTRSTRPPSSRTASVTSQSSVFLAPQTPRKAVKEEDEFATPTPRRRVKSGLPRLSSVSRANSPLPKSTPTIAQPFSFSTPKKVDLAKSTSSIPRRSATSSLSSRRDSIASLATSIFSPPPMQRISSTSTTASSRRDSLSSSVSSSFGGPRRSSSTYAASVLSRSPRPSLSSSTRSTPPKRTQPYRPNNKNKLDREVGKIVNQLNIHVPIEIAEGRWTDESGVYLIGGRTYFCRILRSKQVMVRVGGGWVNLMQFIITHFGVSNGLTISPSTSLKKNLSGAEPEWINSQTVRDQLTASQSSSSLRDYLRSSVSSSLGSSVGIAPAPSDLGTSTSSFAMRRTFSSSSGGLNSVGATPLRRSIAGSFSLNGTVGPKSPTSPSTSTPKSRPPLPIWRP